MGGPAIDRHGIRVSCSRAPAGIVLQTGLVLGAELVTGGPGRILEEQVRYAGRQAITERVEEQLEPGQARAENSQPSATDLDVEIGIGAAEGLDADLMELAVTPGLRLLVAEVGAAYQAFQGSCAGGASRGPHHGGGDLRAQRDVTAALVHEVVHLLADHVGRFPHPLRRPTVSSNRGESSP